MLNLQGIKEFDWLVLRTNMEIKIGDINFAKGEPFLFLNGDKGSIAFSSDVRNFQAKSDVPLIDFNELKNLYISVRSGSINENNLNVLSRAFENLEESKIFPKVEYVRTNDSGEAELKKEPYIDSNYEVFVYHNDNKIIHSINSNVIETSVIDDYLMIYYYYEYNGEVRNLRVNKKDLQGFFRMECLATIYDKINENTRKVLLTTEKVSLQNGFNLLLGPNVGPNMINLTMSTLPDANKDFLKYRFYSE